MASVLPKLQIVYFPVRARAETARMILSYGKVPYQDETSQSFWGKSWPEVKAEGLLPFNQLPALVIDGNILCQSGAINRYCASLVPALIPTTALEAAKADSIHDLAQELTPVNPIVNVFKGEVFQDKKIDFFTNTLPARLTSIERLLKSSGGPFTCGSTPYYCDFAVYHQLDLARLVEPPVFDSFPGVQAFLAAVEYLPGTSDYLTSRPDAVGIGTSPMLRPKGAAGDGN